jgi:hypothetical protein
MVGQVPQLGEASLNEAKTLLTKDRTKMRIGHIWYSLFESKLDRSARN